MLIRVNGLEASAVAVVAHVRKANFSNRGAAAAEKKEKEKKEKEKTVERGERTEKGSAIKSGYEKDKEEDSG